MPNPVIVEQAIKAASGNKKVQSPVAEAPAKSSAMTFLSTLEKVMQQAANDRASHQTPTGAK